MARKSTFSDEQIIAVLKEVEAGAMAREICLRVGVSEKTFHRWKAKFGGMEVSDARRLRTLEDENGKLKELLAEQLLELSAVRTVLAKEW